jgi:hypothetical protein
MPERTLCFVFEFNLLSLENRGDEARGDAERGDSPDFLGDSDDSLFEVRELREFGVDFRELGLEGSIRRFNKLETRVFGLSGISVDVEPSPMS